MKRLAFAVILLVASQPVFAAVQYEFRQRTESDSQLKKPVTIVAKAVIDGNLSRVDYLDGSSVGAGSYVISNGATHDLTVINPKKKTYATRHLEKVEQNQTLTLKISDPKIDFKDLGQGPAIAGYSTHHYRLVARYNVSIKVGSLDLEQTVETTVEKWTTSVFGDVAMAFFANDPAKTGNPELDKLIDAEIGKIPGFPLRQIVTVTARLKDETLARHSQLRINPTRTQRTEMIVTKVGRANVSADTFQIPAGYTDVSRDADGAAENTVHKLSTPEKQ